MANSFFKMMDRCLALMVTFYHLLTYADTVICISICNALYIKEADSSQHMRNEMDYLAKG